MFNFRRHSAIWKTSIIFIFLIDTTKGVIIQVAENGTNVYLPCSIDKYYSKSRWRVRKLGDPLKDLLPVDKDDTNIKIMDRRNNGSLSIKVVQPHYAGTYVCTALMGDDTTDAMTDLLVLTSDPHCYVSQNGKKVTSSCAISFTGKDYKPMSKLEKIVAATRTKIVESEMNCRQDPNNNVRTCSTLTTTDIVANIVFICTIYFNDAPKYRFSWNSSATVISDIVGFTSTLNVGENRVPDNDDESLIIILVVAVGGFLCLLIFSFLGVFIARRSKFAVSRNFNRKIEPDIMRHRDLPEALSIANYSMREMPEMEQQPPENELYINQEEMRHDSQPEINISRASSHQSVPEYQNSIDEMLNQVGSDGTVYIELNGPKLTPTLPIRPRRLPAPPPEGMAHSNSMYALVDHKPRIPPPPPNDI